MLEQSYGVFLLESLRNRTFIIWPINATNVWTDHHFFLKDCLKDRMKDQCPNSYDWKGNDIFFNSLFWLTFRHAQRLSQSKAKYNKFHLDGVGTTIMKLIVVIVNAPIPSLEFVPYAGSMRFLP